MNEASSMTGYFPASCVKIVSPPGKINTLNISQIYHIYNMYITKIPYIQYIFQKHTIYIQCISKYTPYIHVC